MDRDTDETRLAVELDGKYMGIYSIRFSFYVCLKLNMIKFFKKMSAPHLPRSGRR